ncbi:DNA-binding transcriptional regulator, IclR family [Cupriavidus necator]|uniref:IclR family transcriptional regulator n=1 Tax=Cupriavidus necator (strain ATCC 17699 / DSM 428 / KCTC 22496 / NCIMB 10442 / H16 / Stanier 337) TaxID=381666 RepID=Q0K4V6_CUPNH|nr:MULTISPECIES: IclR family transcriptional regulator [Cupriavidus]EON20915.1 IclR family transcriptional regulator [Cupriavidus sp. GA3-3]KUE85462.1 IclR family transcriptional regulator [Cupriavidus necator]QCC02907.1 IclR family transcriptional regulator [Cupriavidus necator H16]QQB79962.1 IclR family transcriptional regulator [Cupriavidus necator]WKA44214.1 IclR family transcriptional regulator [Cupriavidus necator]
MASPTDSRQNPPRAPQTADSAAATPEKPSDSYVQSFARGLSVIRAFNAQHPAQTLTEIAQASGLTRAGARRILLTLVGLGYVQADGRLFRLTPKILDLGFAYLTSMPFWNLAEPIMETLSQQVHESCSISVLDGTEIVYVLRVPARKIMTINLSIGSRLPAYCSSMGRVLLAGLAEPELDSVLRATDLRARTSRTVTDVDALKAIVADIRKRGWALNDQELEEGLVSLAAPIRNRAGHTIAAINISGQANRTSAQEMLERFLPPLLEASEKISGLVGLRT